MKKSWKILTFFGLLVAIVFFIYQSQNTKSCEEAYLELKSISFSGSVSDKYTDDKNHMYKTLVLTKDETVMDTVILSADKSGLFEAIDIGDSIGKEKGSYNVILKKRNTSNNFILDYHCE